MISCSWSIISFYDLFFETLHSELPQSTIFKILVTPEPVILVCYSSIILLIFLLALIVTDPNLAEILLTFSYRQCNFL